MLKKAMGGSLLNALTDIMTVIDPSLYDQADADDYILTELDEKIFFLLKNKKDEFCFTNFGIIHVDGETITSSKRVVRRYDYFDCPIQGVTFETAGMIDRDVEMAFSIGGSGKRLEIAKEDIDRTKDLYKALIGISKLQAAQPHRAQNVQFALGTLKFNSVAPNEITAQLDEVSKWIDDQNIYMKDFGFVFDQFINF